MRADPCARRFKSGLPVSTTQAILKGIVGIRWRVLRTIIIGWLATPLLAGIICFFGLFFLENVFRQAVV